jgi:intracellular sulfur oxidation DsrE/DsrF family protein
MHKTFNNRLFKHLFGLFQVLIVFICFNSFSHADEIDNIINSTEPPDGVVFEIAESSESDLRVLLPKVKLAINKIRSKFPAMQFAVVSHGREEFSLQTKHQSEYAKVHKNVLSLVNDDVPVHVCETYASWYGVTPEDFPDYVDVAPTGPGQISLYEELGYYLVRIE